MEVFWGILIGLVVGVLAYGCVSVNTHKTEKKCEHWDDPPKERPLEEYSTEVDVEKLTVRIQLLSGREMRAEIKGELRLVVDSYGYSDYYTPVRASDIMANELVSNKWLTVTGGAINTSQILSIGVMKTEPFMVEYKRMRYKQSADQTT